MLWDLQQTVPDVRVVSDASGNGAIAMPNWFTSRTSAIYGRAWREKVVLVVVDNLEIIQFTFYILV